MWTIIIITTSCLLISIIIVLIDAKFNLTNERESELTKLLPGYNCGACGFGSCAGMARAIIASPDDYLLCRPLKAAEKEELIAYLRQKKEIN